MKNFSFILCIVIILCAKTRQVYGQDIVSGGSNQWILHTPDDGRTSLHIAPWTNNSWSWSAETIFLDNGDINANGNIQTRFGHAFGCRISDNFNYNNNLIPNYGFLWYLDQSNSNYPLLALSGYGGLKLFTGGRMNFFMNSDGKIGIGAGDPTAMLDVNGTVRAKEVKVESGWADFVFAPNYRLRSLAEVEEFIDQNGHLPDIPTAKEVEQNGVSLGEINAKLLQKVEELTLYLIEKSKKIENLEKRIQVLETK